MDNIIEKTIEFSQELYEKNIAENTFNVEYDLEKARRNIIINMAIKIFLNILFIICVQLLFSSFLEISK